MKTCLKCAATKPLDDFGLTPKGNHRHSCKSCINHGKACSRRGISRDEYAMLLARQDGLCAMCGTPADKTGRRFAIDHDHETGAIRGLLCFLCNTRLGVLEDAAFLARAHQYLKGAHAIDNSQPPGY